MSQAGLEDSRFRVWSCHGLQGHGYTNLTDQKRFGGIGSVYEYRYIVIVENPQPGSGLQGPSVKLGVKLCEKTTAWKRHHDLRASGLDSRNPDNASEVGSASVPQEHLGLRFKVCSLRFRVRASVVT